MEKVNIFNVNYGNNAVKEKVLWVNRALQYALCRAGNRKFLRK